MSIGILLMLVLSSLWLSWSASQASAQTADQDFAECQLLIDNLRGQTQSATFTGQNAEKDRSGLLGKLDSASKKLAEGKPADAIRSLTDFGTKVSTLEAQGKLTPDQIDDASVAEAIACIERNSGS
jgi:hypothetical protein